MTAPKSAKTRNKTINWITYNTALKAFYRLGYAIWKRWSGDITEEAWWRPRCMR